MADTRLRQPRPFAGLRFPVGLSPGPEGPPFPACRLVYVRLVYVPESAEAETCRLVYVPEQPEAEKGRLVYFPEPPSRKTSSRAPQADQCRLV